MKKEDSFLIAGEALEEVFEVDQTKGLDSDEVKKRQGQFGKNKLNEGKRRTFLEMFLTQFKDFLIIVLLAAAIISGLVGELSDAILIIIIVIVNALIGAIQEKKAESSMEALKKMTIPEAKVFRNGKQKVIKSEDLVPGDIVFLDAGDIVPADGRLIEAASLKITESSLTGESVPVEKQLVDLTDPDTPLGDRVNSVYSSSLVNYGRGRFIVTATGMKTEIGKIAGMIQGTKSLQTPLQKKLEELGKILAIGALIACAFVFLIGLIRGGDPLLLFMTAVSLAVAAIPEGLPAIVTVVLAMGVQRLVSKHAIIRKLPAVETLGCASVICSDKTGTLTQNKMTIEKIFADGQVMAVADLEKESLSSAQKLVVKIGLLCNDSNIVKGKNGTQEIGDPTEVAMITLANRFDYQKADQEEKHQRVGELPFDSDRKLMTTVHQIGDAFYSFTKGAPDIILNRSEHIFSEQEIAGCDETLRENLQLENNRLSDQAYRVIAYGYKKFDEMPDVTVENLENNLIFCGLTGMIDPPREEVKDSIKDCKKAGIKTVMITGDHKNTAVAIAKELGIFEKKSLAYTGVELSKMSDEELDQKIENIAVYARVAPEHKVRIVDAWQRKGEVVAMTGDGVNDAPALKKANIGCAMGITGTDVSKEAAEMILTDDNFSTIVSAVEEGRGIYANIRKAIHFLLSCNIAEILILFIASLVGWMQPLLPVHILWINLITDSLPALALGVEKKDSRIMNEKPRRLSESIFSHGLGGRIIYQGIILAIISLVVFEMDLISYGIDVARTMCFAVLGLSQLAHVINVRSEKKSIFKPDLFTNPYLWGAIGISLVLQLSVILIPAAQPIFDVVSLTGTQWFIVVIASLMPIVAVELTKVIGGIIRRRFFEK
ncbi:MAG: P-type Ca2+ transporter type [Eubacteriaceae bacterium]|nr:P-type Ca2+ transporter type [Eubacteriaceae bacterium]